MVEPAINCLPGPITIRKPRAPRRDSLEKIILFPDRDLLAWIEDRARLNERTLSQEIIYRLRRAKEGQEKAAANKSKGLANRQPE